MTDYTDKFSDGRVPAADSSYVELDLTGTTQACWPHMYNGTQPAISDTTVITCAAAAILRLPPTHQVSTGASLLLRNKGSNTLSVQDSNGVSLFSVPAGIAEYVCVAESVAPGAWEHITFGAGVAGVSAGDLAGYGTKAIGNTLASAAPTLSTASSIPLTAAHRGSSIEFTSGVSSLTLSPAVDYTGDFYCFVKNSGAGLVTISATGGELIDGQSTLGLQPNESLILLCNGVNRWYTVGYGRSTIYQLSQLVLDVSAAGTITLNSAQASNKLITLVGNPSSAVTVVVPNIVSVYYVANNLSTNQAVQVKTAAVVGTNIAQTQRAVLLCDGTSVSSAQSASISTVVSMLDGSAAAPALNFSSKTNTGVYKHSTQGIGLTVNGIAQLTSNGAGVDFPAGFGNTAGNVSTSGTLTHSGDMVLSGASKRITGDFSNATEANRVSFQSTTVNGKTIVPLYPNGSGSEVGFSAPTTPFVVHTGGSERLRIDTAGNVGIGAATQYAEKLLVNANKASATYTLVRNADTSDTASAGVGIAAYGNSWGIECGSLAKNSNALTILEDYLGASTERFRISVGGNVLVTSPAGLGYGPGAGGTVTQDTSKGTTVTLNKPCGVITTPADALAANTEAQFLFNNSCLNYADILLVSIQSSPGALNAYSVQVYYTGTGIAWIALKNKTGASRSESVIINFAIIKGAAS